MKVLSNEKGYVKFIFITAILALLVYTGFKFGMPYYKYSAFKSEVKEIARISTGDAEKTKDQIFLKAEEMKVPIEREDIAVIMTKKTVKVNTSWSETVDLLGLYQKDLDFDIDIEE